MFKYGTGGTIEQHKTNHILVGPIVPLDIDRTSNIYIYIYIYYATRRYTHPTNATRRKYLRPQIPVIITAENTNNVSAKNTSNISAKIQIIYTFFETKIVRKVFTLLDMFQQMQKTSLKHLHIYRK